MDLTNTGIKNIPLEIQNLKQLKYLSLDDNDILTIPPEVGQLGNIEILYLSVYHSRLNAVLWFNLQYFYFFSVFKFFHDVGLFR